MNDLTGVNQETPVQSSSSAGPMPGQNFDSDMFLQLLVTQLRYQDPMSEQQDTGDMITQLTMFTMLEQVMSLQESLEEQTESLGNQQALGLLNQQVEITGLDGQPLKGIVSAIDLSSSEPKITVGGHDYPVSSVVRVEGVGAEDG